MKFLKLWYFKKYIYPIFYYNIQEAKKNKEAVVFYSADDYIFTLMIIVNGKATIIIKNKKEPLIIEFYTFEEFPKIISDKILNLVVSTKNNASLFKSYAIIESCSEIIKKMIYPFNINFEEQQQIWNSILSIDPNFLQNNQFVVENNPKNKWVD